MGLVLSRLFLGLGYAGAAGDPVGPVTSTAPSVSPMTAQDGTQVTRTQGSYTARGGGSVSITTSEWRVDGVQVGTGATYTPGAGQVGGFLTYYEVATETGGTAAGTTTNQVTVGTVQAVGGSGIGVMAIGSTFEVA